MVDSVGWFSIILRAVAGFLLLGVLLQQYKELRRQDNGLFGLKIRLTTTVVLLFLANVLALSLNFYRMADGNLLANARHVGMVLNALSTLAIADSFRAIYKYNRQ